VLDLPALGLPTSPMRGSRGIAFGTLGGPWDRDGGELPGLKSQGSLNREAEETRWISWKKFCPTMSGRDKLSVLASSPACGCKVVVHSVYKYNLFTMYDKHLERQL